MHVFIVVVAFIGLMAIFWVNYRLQRTRFPRRGQGRGRGQAGSGEADDPHRASRTFLDRTWPWWIMVALAAFLVAGLTESPIISRAGSIYIPAIFILAAGVKGARNSRRTG
jgi:hypothetical protein